MKKYIIPIIALACALNFSSCIKHMDSPPAGGVDPNLTANFTIDSVVSMYIKNGNQAYLFTQDAVIAGVVVGNDSSGNLYHEVAIEDSTAGIMILLDNSYLYQKYPVGTRLFIKLKGLWVTQKYGVYEIAYESGGALGTMPAAFFANYIFPGKWGINVAPKVVTISQLNSSGRTYLSELIELDNVEFSSGSAGVPFANGYTLTSGNLSVADCNGNSTVVYTSGYADFANLPSPRGNGKLYAIYAVYNGGSELIVRDYGDVAGMTGINCNGAVNGFFPIQAVRAKYTNAAVTLPFGTIIQGTVISDMANGNINPNSLVIQDATGGIRVNFTGANTFALNSKVTIDLTGATLSPTNGWLEVSNVPNANAAQNGTGSITPANVNISQLKANPSAYESTLVQISGVTFSGSSTFSGNITMSDASGNASLYTLSAATFAGKTVPPSSTAVTCIVEQYNGFQLQIRSLVDIQ